MLVVDFDLVFSLVWLLFFVIVGLSLLCFLGMFDCASLILLVLVVDLVVAADWCLWFMVSVASIAGCCFECLLWCS